MAAAITMSLSAQGVIGAFWCYPAVVFLFFVLPRRAAIVANGGLLLAASVQVYRYLGLSTAVRFTVSLVLTIVVVTIIQNVIRELQQRLLDQAITDPLTGAFNRRYMAERLDEAIERQRRSGAPASVLIIDLDHFKRVNDDLGHEAGDAVLKGIVALLGRRSRRVDLLFRMGGEEFLLLLPDTAEEQAASWPRICARPSRTTRCWRTAASRSASASASSRPARPSTPGSSRRTPRSILPSKVVATGWRGGVRRKPRPTATSRQVARRRPDVRSP
jgi:diguanylate cyclase (GGDEF)-like protein